MIYAIILIMLLVIVLVGFFLFYRFRINSWHKKIVNFLEKLLIKFGARVKGSEPQLELGEIKADYRKKPKAYLNYLSKSIEELFAKFNENLNLMRFILDYIPYGILVINRKREILKINETLLNLFYLKKENVLGSKTIFVFNNKKLENLISRSASRLVSQKESIIFFEDEDLYLSVEAIPIDLIGRDVEDRGKALKRIEKENPNLLLLFKNTTQEVEFSKLRSQFVANVSHEMRTPLTSIKGYVETLIDSGMCDDKKVKNYLQRTLKEINRLNILIGDVLNLSKIEYKRNVLLEEGCNLVDIINETIEQLEFLAEKNDIDIKFSHKQNELQYNTDRELFSQMVRNIIENSIFYAGKGSKMEINLEEDKNNIELVLADNGKGISKKDLPYIFQRFYRGKNPYSLKHIGSGLGLSIVKHIVELHNGKITVSSMPNIETKFTIILPK